MAVFSLFYGTVSSGKSEAIFTSACILSKRYEVNYLLIKPDLLSNEEKIVRSDKKSCIYNNSFTLSSFFSQKRSWRGTLIVHVQHFHLFTIDELNFMLKFFKFKDALVGFWGLKRDYTGKIYEQFDYLLPKVDYVEKLPTMCSICETREAEYNMGMIDDEPMAFPIEEKHLIGATFIPVCEKCFVPPIEAQELD